jgi:hypothetical protein
MPEPTEADLGLLADIQALKVYEDDDGTPRLDLGDEPNPDVGGLFWPMWQKRWIFQPHDARGYRLTQRGLDVLEGRVAG